MQHTRPLEWFYDNLDGMVLALIATFSAATVAAFLKGARGVTILISLLSAFMLTGMSVPVAAIYWSLHWVWWPVIGVGVGMTSLSIMWFAIKFAERLQSRAPDFADGVGKRFVPELRDPPDGPKP
ncbi:MAG: hypothetical protein K9G48_08640 [Reyranella sp.]|nr:hypothetical protein [Reyranella sp.]